MSSPERARVGWHWSPNPSSGELEVRLGSRSDRTKARRAEGVRHDLAVEARVFTN